MDATPNHPGTRVPPPHAGHPLVAGRYFFTLPKELLEDAVAAVGEERFDPPLLDLERALSVACGDHSEVVGFRAGVPVRYGLLGRPPGLAATAQEVTDAMSKELGWAVTPAHLASLGVIDDRLERAREVCRAYNGWLALNPQFASEQTDFFARWGVMARRVGLEAPTPGAEDRARHSMADYAAFADDRDRLLRRWELAGLVGPFLPDPPRPHAPLAGGVDAVLPDPRLGTTFFFPRIFPLPDRQELSRMIDDAMARHRLPPHLKGWSDLIATDNPGRGKALPRLGRVFVLQHYWRALFARHAPALQGQVGRLHEVFAAFLFPDADPDDGSVLARAESIRKHLTDLSRARGGPDWATRPTPGIDP